MGTARPGYSLRSRIGKGFEGQRLCDPRIPWPRPTSESIRRLLRITAFGCDLSQPAELPARPGWELQEAELLRIDTPGGKSFTADRYIAKRGEHREILIYWYQGRGRTTPSEYEDKFYTSLDSVIKRRSDGAMIRIMTPVGDDEAGSVEAAIDLSEQVADNIAPFVPE